MGLFEHLPTPAISLDPDIRILKANIRAQSLLGWRSPPAEPVSFTQFLASTEISAFTRFFQHLACDRELVLTIGIFPRYNLGYQSPSKERERRGESLLLLDRNDIYFTGCGGKCLHTAILEAEYQENPGGIVLVNEKMEMISCNNEFVKIWNIPQEIIHHAMNRPACRSLWGLLSTRRASSTG